MFLGGGFSGIGSGNLGCLHPRLHARRPLIQRLQVPRPTENSSGKKLQAALKGAGCVNELNLWCSQADHSFPAFCHVIKWQSNATVS